jgi:hypothetical protein
METKAGWRALVINALSRLFMEPAEDPAAAAPSSTRIHSATRWVRSSWTSIARLPEKTCGGTFLRRTS